ncbi:MAG: hypothetical protein E7617_07050 [Ruminococcaceae bacterium]|nr:hypothetical protein [Oscillospiraceae bacterium]
MSVFTWDDTICGIDLIFVEIKCRGNRYRFRVEKGDDFFVYEVKYRGCENVVMKVRKDQVNEVFFSPAKIFKPGLISISFKEMIQTSLTDYETDRIVINSSKNNYRFLLIYKFMEHNGIEIL